LREDAKKISAFCSTTKTAAATAATAAAATIAQVFQQCDEALLS